MKNKLLLLLTLLSASVQIFSAATSGPKHSTVNSYVKLLHDNPHGFEGISSSNAKFVDYYCYEIQDLYKKTYGDMPAKQADVLWKVEHKGFITPSSPKTQK